MKAFKNKLKSKKGFSITEMLVVVAILSLLTVAISTSMTGAMTTYQTSVKHSESAVLTSTLTQTLNDELRYARDIEIEGTADTGKLKTYTSSVYGKDADIGVNTDGQVTVKSLPILGSGAYTGLSVDLKINYNTVAKLFDVTIITEKNTEAIQTTVFQISPINQ